MGELFHEIEIRGSVYPSAEFHRRWLATEYPEGGQPYVPRPIVPVGELLDAIAAAARDGVRVLLLIVDSPGGNNAACHRVYSALRAFPGQVVAYVTRAMSAMPILVQAADVVVLDPGGELVFHGTIPSRSAPDTTEANAVWMRLLEERVGLDPRTWGFLFERWDAYGGFKPEQALRHGLADVVGELEDARRIAADLAAGGPFPSSARRAHLARRRSSPPIVVEVPATASSEAPNSGISTYDPTARIRMQAASTWEPGNAGTAGHTWFSVAEIPSTGRLVVVTNTGVPATGCYTSDDSGRTWQARTMPAGTFYAVRWCGTTLIATGSGTTAATSTDGATWTPRTMATTSPAGFWRTLVWTGTHAVAMDDTPGGPAVCQRSSDGGVTWSTASMPTTAWVAAESDGAGSTPSTGTIVAVSLNGSTLTFRRSTDSGATWSAPTGATPNNAASGFAVVYDPVKATWLVAGGRASDVITSRDGGASWAALTMPAGASSYNVISGAWGNQVYVLMAYATTQGDDRCYVISPDTFGTWRAMQFAMKAVAERTIFCKGALALNRFLTIGWYYGTTNPFVAFSAPIPL